MLCECMYITSEQRNNSSAVVGAVLGTLTVVLVVAVTITVAVLFILSWRVSLTVQYYSYDTLTFLGTSCIIFVLLCSTRSLQ